MKRSSSDQINGMSVEDNPKKGKYQCRICLKFFDRVQNLQNHMRTMHHVFAGGARSNARRGAANQNDPGYTIKNIDNINNFHDVTRNIIDNVTEALQNYNQGVKYYVSLDVEFKKMLEGTITDPPITFRTEMYRLLRHAPNDINDQTTQIRETLNNSIDTFIQNGSGWVFNKFGRMQVKMFDYRPMAGGGGISTGFFKAPEWITAKKAIINVQNTDEKCFLWSILAALHPAEKDAARVTKYKPYEHELDTSCLKFPVNPGNEAMLAKFETNNNISLNIYGLYDDDGQGDYENGDDDDNGDGSKKIKKHKKSPIIPFRIAKEKKAKHVNLLLLENENGNVHYTWLKNMSRLLYGQKGHKHHCKRFYCDICMNTFNKEETLKKHSEFCTPNGYVQAVKYPEENELKFQNFENQMILPFIIYADFECVLKDISNGSTTYQEHVPISYAFHIESIDTKWSHTVETYTGEDCIEQFLLQMDYYNEEIREMFKKTVPMTELNDEQLKNYNEATNCYCCTKSFNMNDANLCKVKDHCHITGQYRGAACSHCNLNITAKTHTIPVVFHNLKGYDMHHILLNLDNRYTRIIATSTEKIISAKIEGLKYIDSLSFLSSSLATLAGNLPKDEFKSVREYLQQRLGNSQQPQSDIEIQRVEAAFDMITRKGVYPYDWMNDTRKLQNTSLPPKDCFYSKLNDSHITDDEYEHAKRVWEFFNCQTFKDYHELYLATDVLLLTDVFQSFRRQSLESYSLDPACYISLPGLAWDAMLLKTGVSLELLSKEKSDIYLMVEQGIRGGISVAIKRHAKADENSALMYLDANNLYGWAMSQPLPYGGFKMLDNVQNVNVIELLSNPNQDIGYIFKVDLEYPTHLHDAHSDLPLAPERFTVEEEMLSEFQTKMHQKLFNNEKYKTTPKLIPNLYDKKGYIIHEATLKQCLDLGLRVTKVHNIVEFKQSTWLKDYIDFNTQKRTNAKNDFEKDFFKLMNNAVFGKTMENVRNHSTYEICTGKEQLIRWVRNPIFYGVVEIDENTLIVVKKKKTITLRKPIYIGFSILDISKTLMYDFHYKFAKPNLPNAQLCYMDTDSFIYHIPMSQDAVNKVLKEHADKFDFSNYDKEHGNYSTENKKVIGKMKDELGGIAMEEFIGLRSKMYSCKIADGSGIKKAKGIKKNVVKREIVHENYIESLKEERIFKHQQRNIESHKHVVHSTERMKISLNPFDDKRYILNDGFNTLAHGHHTLGAVRMNNE